MNQEVENVQIAVLKIIFNNNWWICKVKDRKCNWMQIRMVANLVKIFINIIKFVALSLESELRFLFQFYHWLASFKFFF